MLRSILRQDPDVVLVGEMRDSETAQLAVQAALTGHVVFSTLHTNDAVGAIPRLLDLGVAPYLISATLEAVLAQRLVRKICTGCRDPRNGCAACRGTGFNGRTGVFELLVMTDEIREALGSQPSRRRLETLAAAAGCARSWPTAPTKSRRESPRRKRCSVSRNSSRQRAGFTLMEMMVVLAIIGTLAMVVGPSVFKHVGDANTTTAKSQIEIFASRSTPIASIRVTIPRPKRGSRRCGSGQPARTGELARSLFEESGAARSLASCLCLPIAGHA